MKPGWIVLTFCIFCTLVFARTSLGEDLTPVMPGPDDKCPVCGMFVAKYPEWIGQIIFSDQTIVYFDGAKDLFKFYFDMEKYGSNRRVENVGKIFVTEYYDLKPIDAKTALFVVGSDVYGPMGHELIPFVDEAAAREFMKDHNGRKLYQFSDITTEIIKPLD